MACTSIHIRTCYRELAELMFGCEILKYSYLLTQASKNYDQTVIGKLRPRRIHPKGGNIYLTTAVDSGLVRICKHTFTHSHRMQYITYTKYTLTEQDR